MNGQAIAALAVAGAAAGAPEGRSPDPTGLGSDRVARVGGEARFAEAAADRAQARATRP